MSTRLSRSSATPSAALSLSNSRLYVVQRIRGGLSGYSSSVGSPPSLRRSLRARRRALSYLHHSTWLTSSIVSDCSGADGHEVAPSLAFAAGWPPPAPSRVLASFARARVGLRGDIDHRRDRALRTCACIVRGQVHEHADAPHPLARCARAASGHAAAAPPTRVAKNFRRPMKPAT